MNSSTLDWSIQSALSSLYPPFEATAPTVLSQLFCTIEARYQGDSLQCFLDYLIPAKHILESVQQAACAEYSDVLFRCEGWPLCLRDRVVIQLAPINPLLLRPGDFYLQVEPFGEQSARIVLKSLLVQEEILAQDDLVLLAGFRAQEGPAVEETPIPETSYPCIFTKTWLEEINEGRHGHPLHQCVLSSDQGIVKVPWAEVINPEFLDRPKANTECKTSCATAGLIQQNNSEEEPKSSFPVNMSFPKSSLEPETMILSAKKSVAVSHRLVKSGNKFVKVEGNPVSNPVGKPVGWVSPNTCERRPSRELEGEYVDLLDFAKEKDALIAGMTSISVHFRPHSPLSKGDKTPCAQATGPMDKHSVPCSKNKNPFSEFPQKASESKGRHRQSYLAAIKNPVSFEKANTALSLNETWPGLGEAEPSDEALGVGTDSLSSSPVQGSTQLGQKLIQPCPGSAEQDKNSFQLNVGTVHPSQDTVLPNLKTAKQSNHLLIEKLPDSIQKTVQEHTDAGNVNRPPCMTELEPRLLWDSVYKHQKTQHLPKMGLRAFPDHRSHRQESGAYTCQGLGKGGQIDQFVSALASPHESLQQPTRQRSSQLSHPHNRLKMLQEQNSHLEQRAKCEYKQCGESSVRALKGLGKSRPKTRSASTVSEPARECSQEDRPASRSHSDVCPEIIPMVPGVQVQRSKKCTTFGFVSPKLDRRKAAKNDMTAPGSTEQFAALQNGAVLQSSSAQFQNLSPEHGSQLTALSHDPTIKNLLQLGIICLPGSRDRSGRAVLEVHGGKSGWASPLLSPPALCKLFFYLHFIPRKQVRDLGLTIIINSRKGPIPSVFYKALLMVQDQVPHAVHNILVLVEKDQSPRTDRPQGLQVDIITSLRALHKSVDGQQLTCEFGGFFPYNHNEWLQFYQKLFLFKMDLQGAALLLQNAISQLDSNKKTDTAEDVRRCRQEQKSAMKQVLEDTHMVMLQRDGGAILARMRKEECRFAQSEDYRDSMEAVMCLYNQVEEGVHTLVMRSNQSLQHLDHMLLLRETEEQLTTSREWCVEESRRWQRDFDPAEESKEILEQRLVDICAVLTQAKERKEKAVSLMKDVERKIQGTSYPETDIFHIHITKFKTNLAAFMLQAEQHKSDLEAFIHLFLFCEQAYVLSKECSHYLEHMEMGCYPEKANICKLKSYQGRFKAFSPEHFEEERSNTMIKKYHGMVRVWTDACSVCQEVKQVLEQKLLEFDRKQKLQKLPQVDKIILKNDEDLLQAPTTCTAISSMGNLKTQSQRSDAHRHKQNKDKHTQGESVNIHKKAAPTHTISDQLVKFSREHHSEADLRNVDPVERGERNRALGRSLSEGSCVRSFSSELTGPPLSVCHKTSPSKPCMLLADQECAPLHPDSFCSDCSNMKVEWIQMDSGDTTTVSLDNQDSQISRQESFCSSVSSPRQGWMEEEKSNRIYLDDENPGSPSRDSRTSDRLKESSDCISASELENSSDLVKLQHIMEELLQTEREYVKTLGYVMEHYFPELDRQDVPQDLRGQRGSIFGNLEKLREFHQHHFVKELEICLKHPFRVGQCFLRHKESFGLYALYSKNKPRSDHLLINHGREFFKQKQQLLGDKMDLSSYLLKPVQRISKYNLLLQDMLQECDATSRKAPERAELQEALEVIQFQLRHGNNLLAMDDIQNCDVNLKEQGQLIRQDEFLVSIRKKKSYRHIFLFHDLILFSKTKKSDVGNDIYIYKQSFKTSDIGMTHNCGDSGLCFEIWFRRRKSQDTYTLQARSYEVKQDWTKDLERILWVQAIHNREIRMQERVFMGIGCKPFMDIKPSEAAICNRAVNCAITGRDCKAPLSGMSNTKRGFPVQRPSSTGSASYVSSCSHSSSSSSSGRESISPVGYHIGLSRRVVSVSDPGRFSNPGEHDLDQENIGQNRLVDNSESSGESVSGLSSSGYSFQSVTGGEHEVLFRGVSHWSGEPCSHKNEDQQQHKDKSSKPQNQKRDQPFKVQGNNHIEKSTEV